MSEHELKCHPNYFQAVWDYRKQFELRKNDRGFQTGDTLLLKEYDPAYAEIGACLKPGWTDWKDGYSGRTIKATVTYLFHAFGLEPGFCILGIAVFERNEP